jgi:hypothetical protein
MRRNGVVSLREILGLRSKSKKDAKLIAAFHRTGFFDAAYYLANNPDVAANGIDPASILLSGVGRRGASLALGSTQCISNWVRFAKTLYNVQPVLLNHARCRDPGNYPNIS